MENRSSEAGDSLRDLLEVVADPAGQETFDRGSDGASEELRPSPR